MKSNKIYRGLIGECKRLESEGIYIGNGHHLAQRLTASVLVELLSKRQRHFYDNLSESYRTAKEIAEKAGMKAKEISVYAKQINIKGTLVISTDFDGVVKYKKA